MSVVSVLSVTPIANTCHAVMSLAQWMWIFCCFVALCNMHPCAPLSVAVKPTGHGRHAVLQYQARGMWHWHWLLIEQHNVNRILFYPFGPLKSQLLPVLSSQAPPQNWSCIDPMHVVLTHRPDNTREWALMPHGWLDSFDPAPQFTSEHHLLHAFYAFYTSPFQKALVVVVDGCGPKSPTGGCESSVLYAASRRGTVELLANETVLVPIRLGRLFEACGYNPYRVEMASMGSVDGEYVAQVVDLLSKCVDPLYQKVLACMSTFFKSHKPHTAARLGAIQVAAEQALVSMVSHVLQHNTELLPQWDGIVLAGGVAANRRLAYVVGQEFNLPVWRPSLPGDDTLGFGGTRTRRSY